MELGASQNVGSEKHLISIVPSFSLVEGLGVHGKGSRTDPLNSGTLKAPQPRFLHRIFSASKGDAECQKPSSNSILDHCGTA